MNLNLKKSANVISTFIIGSFILLAIGWKEAGITKTTKVNDVTNTSIDVSILVFIPCANGGAGEFVTVSGPLHILTSFNINGNNIRGFGHDQPQGISGIGSITGDKYQATGVTQFEIKGSLTNGQYEFTFINNFRIIGQGPGNNFLVHQTIHETINANGTVTAEVLNSTFDCK